MSLADETRRVRDPSTGEIHEVQESRPAISDPASRHTNPRGAGSGSAAALPPRRLVVVDGVVCGEVRTMIEVWDILEGRGFDRKAAIAATLHAQQLPDRIVIKTKATR